MARFDATRHRRRRGWSSVGHGRTLGTRNLFDKGSQLGGLLLQRRQLVLATNFGKRALPLLGCYPKKTQRTHEARKLPIADAHFFWQEAAALLLAQPIRPAARHNTQLPQAVDVGLVQHALLDGPRNSLAETMVLRPSI